MKFVCIFICLLLTFFLPVANAEGQWVRVTEEGVNLYATCESSKVIFQLEKSYYLQVLSEQNGMYQVAVMPNTADFPQITGYVWIGEVDDCDQAPVTPYYPTVKITVNSHSAPVKLSPLPSAQTLVTVTNTQNMSYYGEITSYGQLWYYVYFGGTFGYVQADAVTQPVISPHPTPLPQDVVTPPQTPEQPSEQQPAEQQGGTEIFLIIFVAVLAAAVCLAVFLPGNVKKKDAYDKDM